VLGRLNEARKLADRFIREGAEMQVRSLEISPPGRKGGSGLSCTLPGGRDLLDDVRLLTVGPAFGWWTTPHRRLPPPLVTSTDWSILSLCFTLRTKQWPIHLFSFLLFM
jgi:hypothetical protein